MFGIDWYAVVMVIMGIFTIVLVEGSFVACVALGVGGCISDVRKWQENARLCGQLHCIEGIVCWISLVIIGVPASIWFAGLVIDCVTKWLGGL